jgi:DNA-binding MarR family transcriptional regulator
MLQTDKNSDAYKLADLTFHLLAHFREKEIRFAEKHDLTQAEFRCLKYFGTNECMSNKEIAERMKLTQGRLTRIIDSLIMKKYMMREIDLTDRRYMRVNLSKNGNSLLAQLNSDYIDIHRDILAGIESHQKKPLIAAMTNLVAAVKIWRPKS